MKRSRARCLAAAFLGAMIALPAHAFFYSPPPISAIEYVNDISQRRVLITNAAEIAFLDQGKAGPGWRRSGLTMGFVTNGLVKAGVARFYAPSVNSHFFTLTESEIDALKNPLSGWFYERIDFSAGIPSLESCEGTGGYPFPVYRLYNNRAAFGDPTHRYTPDIAVRKGLEAKGWSYERVAFCSSSWFYNSPSYRVSTNKVLPSAECEDESRNLGSCVGLNQTAAMNTVVARNELDVSGVFPGSPLRLPSFKTGADGAVRTALATYAGSQIAEHSFVQIPPLIGGMDGYGIYVNSRDRVAAPGKPLPVAMSINPLHQFITSAPATGEADKRVMPWRDAVERSLDISFNLRIAYVRRGDAQSHAISHPTIELIDTKSRRNLYITLGGAQTVALPGSELEDYFAADTATGKIIVSTSFRDKPAFGQRIAGDTIFCDADANTHRCNQTANDYFAFRLRRADIAYVIAKARRLDPLLSADIADYAIDNFSFNNETFNNAEIGLLLHSYSLEIREQQF